MEPRWVRRPVCGKTTVVRRRDQRRAAVFALYQHDATGQEIEAALPRDAHTFTKALAQAVDDHREELDVLIERHAQGWALDRIAPLERAILRTALFEILHPDEVPGEQPIPAEGAIEEAVETAKTFCSAQAPGFVNGILGAVLEELRQNPSTR
ncbi:MAG: transcription antitermination protein NusB [Solirubrobacteraceae bacterium]|jgi:N utilization substance protein B|nr:transcription antitermination protein NusB [Solirubrobacteraceae bacterium]